MSSPQSQIDADAALARRLQEEEFSHANLPFSPVHNTTPPIRHPPRAQSQTPPHYPQPNQPRNVSRTQRRHPQQQNVRYPFARGNQDFDTNDMLDEMFRRVRQTSPSTFESLLEFGNFPGRPHVVGGQARNAPPTGQQPPDELFNRLFGDDFMEGGGRFVVMPPGAPFGGSEMPRGDGGAMEMMNMLFSQAFQPFQGMGGSGAGGGFTNIGDMLRAVVHGGEGGESYEDWLAMIERMGGNVNRGATDEEVNRLHSRKFERNSGVGGGAGPSSAGGASSMRDGQKTGTRTEDEEADKCAVCLGEYEEGEDVKQLPCMHMFHAECIDRWLKLNRICPVCKTSIREGDGPAD